MSKNFERTSCEVAKVDDELGLVFGFAIVCSKNGEPYVDLQDDIIPEESMLKAAAEFMTTERIAGDMHKTRDGLVVFAFPLTAEIAKSLDIQTTTTGLLIAIKPSPEVLVKYKTGEYTGFSIGGTRRIDRKV